MTLKTYKDSSTHHQVTTEHDHMGKDQHLYPKAYQRPRSILNIAFWLGLTSVRKISFSKDGIRIHFKKNETTIDYKDIKNVSLSGALFKSVKIDFSRKISIRGLSSLEAKQIMQRIIEAEEVIWKIKFSEKANQIDHLTQAIDQIYERTVFLRYSRYEALKIDAQSIVAFFGSHMPDALKETSVAKGLLKIKNFLDSLPLDREKINEEYVLDEIKSSKDLFDNIESNPLTEEQRRAVVIDEDANLIIAAAGSGKTSVIVAKTAWILEKGNRNSSELLLLSFANAARKEIKERLESRIKRSDIDEVNVHTFHSLGLHIIGKCTHEKPTISILAEDEMQLSFFVKSTIQKNLNDQVFRNLMIVWFGEFFAKYESEFNFKSSGKYYEYLRKHNIRSLKGEKLKSFEECQIANFLTLNGIDYKYEPQYEYKTADSNYRQYKPDFYLPQYGVYIEHLGLKGFGRSAPFVDRKNYLKSLRWKRDLHKKHGTTLIETYSCEKEQGILSNRLQEKLEAVGVKFLPVNPDEIFKKLDEKGQIDTFTKLVVTFLGHFKGGQLSEKDLWKKVLDDENKDRNSAFIRVFMPIFEKYENYLKLEGAIDFHDMISAATDHIQNGNYDSSFRYIMVDEFQDISVGRSNLIKAIQQVDPDVQLYCVGDDWQAIFRFAGSDINVMKEFGENFGTYERSDLTTNFRSEQNIVGEATNFILQNDFQIKKSVKSQKISEQASINVCFLDSGAESREKIFELVIREIINSKGFRIGSEILFLGRYKIETYLRAYNIDYKKILANLEKIYSEVKIKFLTVHQSKGLESDYVVVLDVLDDFLGFPNEQADDPILNLVLSKSEDFPNSEERRLFYVALTRAKIKIFLLTETGKVSPFISEVIQSPFDVEIFGRNPKTNISCPECETGVLNLKRGPSNAFWGCSNFPYCEYTEQACPHCNKGKLNPSTHVNIVCDVCEQSVEKCPTKNCKGWLQVRSGKNGNFLGCTEFFKTGCTYTRNIKIS